MDLRAQQRPAPMRASAPISADQGRVQQEQGTGTGARCSCRRRYRYRYSRRPSAPSAPISAPAPTSADQGRVFAKTFARPNAPRLPSGVPRNQGSTRCFLSNLLHSGGFGCPVGPPDLWLFSLGCRSWPPGAVQGMPCACISQLLQGLRGLALPGPKFKKKKSEMSSKPQCWGGFIVFSRALTST